MLLAKNNFLFEIVQKGLHGPKRGPNGKKTSWFTIRTLLESWQTWHVCPFLIVLLVRFFGTPPTTIDHRAHLCSERGTDGKAVAGRPDEILQQARETGKCLYILNICWCITVFWWESYYLFISFPLDLTEIIESLGVKAFRESTGNGNQKISDAYFAAMHNVHFG